MAERINSHSNPAPPQKMTISTHSMTQPFNARTCFS